MISRFRLAAFASLLVLGAGALPAAAQDKGLADRILSRPAATKAADCNSPVLSDLEQCAVQRFRAADAELNRVYRDIGGDPRNREILLSAQRTWLAYRDATCAWEQDLRRDGREALLNAIACLANVTEARAAYLQQATGP